MPLPFRVVLVLRLTTMRFERSRIRWVFKRDRRILTKGSCAAESTEMPREIALAFTLLAVAGCGAVCPPDLVKRDDRCVEPGEDSGITDAARDATPDAAPDDCGGCVAGRFCFLALCVPEDRCTEAIGVPCPTAGPQFLKSPQPTMGALFGLSVATSSDGSTAVVGEPLASAPNGDGGQVPEVGAVHIYQRTGSLLARVTSFTPDHPTTGDNFGRALALSGDGTTLAVAAADEDGKSTSEGGSPSDNTVGGAGAVFMYRKNATTGVWAFEQYLKASDAASTAYFGFRIALDDSGSRMVVGARGRNGNRGAVYVFSYSAGGWSEDQIEQAPDGEAGDEFGRSVAMSGDGQTFVAGAPFEQSNAAGVGGDRSDNSLFRAGAAYVYRNTGTSWLFDEYIKTPVPGSSEEFATSVALNHNGTLLAVGAPTGVARVDDDFVDRAGAVYLYQRSEAGWAAHETLRAAEPRASAVFGNSVSLTADGSRLAIGARGDDLNAPGIQPPPTGSRNSEAGAVFLFARDGTAPFQQTARIKAPVIGSADRFANWVDLAGAGAWLMTGAEGEDSPNLDPTLDALAESGAAYMYRVGE